MPNDILKNLASKANAGSAVKPTDMVTTISAKDFNANRYPTYYTGVSNQEEIYAQTQGVASKYFNGLTKGLGLTATTFVGGTVGLVHGLFSSIATGEFDKLYDNSTNNALSDFSKRMEDWFPNYYTQSERDAKWYSPDTWATANFWSDTILKNLGFAAGAYFSGGLITKGMGAVGGLANSLRGLKTAQSASALALIDDAGSFAARQGSSIVAGLPEAGASIVNSARSIAGSSAWKNWGKNLTHSVLSAAGEASIEALHAKHDYKDKLVEEYRKNTGRDPDENQLKEIEEVASKVGNTVFGANMAILTASNVLMFPALSKTAKAETGVIAPSERKALLNVADADGKIIKRSWKYDQKLKVNTAAGEKLVASNQSTGIGNIIEAYKVGRVINRISPVAKMMFAPSEAIEEGLQTYSTIAAEAYFDKGSATKGQFWNTLQASFHDALEQKDFWVALMSGGISGGLMMNFNPMGNFLGGIRDRKASIANSNRIANDLNNNGVGGYVTEIARSVARQEALSQEARAALDNGDKNAYEDRKWDSIINYLMPRMMYGRKSLVDQDVENWRDLASTEEGWKKIQEMSGIGEEMSKEEFIQGLEKIKQTSDKMSTIFEGLNLRYGNSYDTSGNKTHTPEVISKLAYLATKIDIRNTNARETMNDLMSVGINAVSLTDFMQSNEVSEEKPFTITYPDGTTRTITSKSSDVLQDVYGEFVSKAITKLESSSEYTSDQIEDAVVAMEGLLDTLANRKYEVDLYEDMSKNPYNYREEFDDATVDEDETVVGPEGFEETPKSRFYFDVEGERVLLDFGTRGQKSGVIRYDSDEDILAVEVEEGDYYEITAEDFKTGLARFENSDVHISEDFLNAEDPRIAFKQAERRMELDKRAKTLREKLSDRGTFLDSLREKLNTVLDKIKNHPSITMKEYSELVAARNKAYDKVKNSSVTKKAQKDFEDGKITPEELETIIQEEMDNAGVTEMSNRIDELDRTMPTYESVSETVSELNDLKLSVENEIQEVSDEMSEIEDQISVYDEMMADEGSDYNYALNELEEQIFQLEEASNALKSQRSKLEGLLGKITNAIEGLAEAVRNAAKLNPTGISGFVVKAADTFLGGGTVENFISSLKGKIEKLSMLRANREKVERALNEVNESIEQIENEMADKFELWEQLVENSERIHYLVNPGHYLSSEEIKEITSTEEDSSEELTIGDTVEEDSNIGDDDVKAASKFFNGAKKILSRLFKSTIVLPNMTKTPKWHQRYEKAIQNMALLPWTERSSHRVMLITANNESSVGLSGLVDSMTPGQFKTEAEKVDKYGGAILAVLVREKSEGTFEFLDENLQPISSPTIDTVVATKMPVPALSYGATGEINHSKPETVNVTPDELAAAYTNLREQILSETTAGRVHPFHLSRGQLPLDDSENTIVDNLIPNEGLSDRQMLRNVKKGETITSEDGETFTPGKGSVLFLEHDGTFTPIYVSRFKPAARRGVLHAINHIRVNHPHGGVDERYVKFLQTLLPKNMKFDISSGKIKVGKKEFDINDGNFEKDFLHLLERSKPSLNHEMMESFDEVLEDSSIKNWPTFQEFLLSTDGRSAYVHTNIASKKLQHRYMILNDFFDDHRTSGTTTATPTSPTSVPKDMIESLAEGTGIVDKDKLKTFLRNLSKRPDILEDILEANKVITKYDC